MAERRIKKAVSKFPAVDLIGYAVSGVSFKVDLEHLNERAIQIDRNDLLRDTSTQRSDETPSIWQIEMHLGIKRNAQKKYAYHWDLSLLGVLKCDIPERVLDAAQLQDNILLNGCSLLYTTAREYLRSLTALALKGPILLPTVTFALMPSTKKQHKTKTMDSK